MCCLCIVCKGVCFLYSIFIFCEVEFMILLNRKVELSFGLIRCYFLKNVFISIGGRFVCGLRVLDYNLIRRF